jgi:hypothetical protein
LADDAATEKVELGKQRSGEFDFLRVGVVEGLRENKIVMSYWAE